MQYRADPLHLAGPLLSGPDHLAAVLPNAIHQQLDRTRHGKIKGQEVARLHAQQVPHAHRGSFQAGFER
jgi:hypothetical protein